MTLLLSLTLLLPLAPLFADDCGDKKVTCYTELYQACQSEPNVEECVNRGSERCKALKCDETQAAGLKKMEEKQAAAGGPYNVRLNSTCREEGVAEKDRKGWEKQITTVVGQALKRWEDCQRYAFLKPDLAQKINDALKSEDGIAISCHEFVSRDKWCAGGGMGEVIYSPSKALVKGSVCHDQLGSLFIHEVGHSAGLAPSANHNEGGESYDDFDEIYSLERYCMNNARMWIGRSKRTRDVVQPDYLQCMRCYQEKTPSTLEDPFWLPVKRLMKANKTPCPCQE